MKKQVYIAIGAIIIVIIALYYFLGGESSTAETIKTKVKSGEFKITVTTAGELEAKSSENILGPEGLQNVRIWQLKIEDMVPDGTVVDSGDFVASLDRTELANKMKDQELEVDQYETQHTKTKLDTTLELRTLRDDLINLNYSLEEKKIELDQSKYESPAIIRQAQIDLERAQRSYEQAVENYQLKLEKAEANMQEVTGQLNKAQKKYDDMAKVLSKFTVYAPKAGMVIYKRGWDGKKQGIGSQIGTWENIVATLPNLKEMISKTYVNEIDISKVKVGQPVDIGIDAFPEKKFTGKVTEVANIGEQMKNSNAKVFEIHIDVNEFDSVMRPAMTTKNIIITDVIDSALYLPIECIHSEDSISYVVAGKYKKQVIVGKSNENEIIIKAGLEAGEDVYLVPPDDFKDFRLEKLPDDVIKEYYAQNAMKKNKALEPANSPIEDTLAKDTGKHFQDKKFLNKGKKVAH